MLSPVMVYSLVSFWKNTAEGETGCVMLTLVFSASSLKITTSPLTKMFDSPEVVVLKFSVSAKSQSVPWVPVQVTLVASRKPSMSR